METPDEWPLKIRESYDAIRTVGKGGFASVILAREKKTTTTVSTSSGSSKNNEVAIKVIGGIYKVGTTAAEIKEQRDQAEKYARREIEILKHIQHHNIVRMLDHWYLGSDNNENETKNRQQDDLTAGVLILEYIKGATVERLLKHGGALSTTFGRIIIAQTMDAVAYLHCHAVLHRDIKPDNILVTGAVSSDDFIWDNGENTDNDEPNWKALRAKYKVTLIDFGFARALTPIDVSKPSQETSRKDSELASYHRISNHADAYMDKKGDDDDDLGSSRHYTSIRNLQKHISQGTLDSSVHRFLSRNNNSQKDELSNSTRSISHAMKRTMSTLGNKNFAAPEIINKVRLQYRPRAQLNVEKSKEGTTKIVVQAHVPTTETISDYVADYGLLVDSYSMGHSISYMMTGVQPGISVEDVILRQSGGFIGKFFSLCFGAGDKGKQQKRSVRYRRIEELPAELCHLIGSLTQVSEKKRISIRKARWNVPWINNVLESQKPPSGENDYDNNEQNKEGLPPPLLDEQASIQHENNGFYHISYLPFATGNTTKPITRESDVTTCNTRVDASVKTINDNPVDPNDTETALTF